MHPRVSFPVRRCGLFALWAIVFVALAACSDPRASTATPTPSTSAPVASPTAAAFPLTVTGADGQALTLPAPARAIVSHSPGATEILFAIGAGGQLVAADEFSNYPAAAKGLKRVKYSDPNPETEIALQPDLVILATNQKAQVEPFRRIGLPVLYNQEPPDIDGVLANISLLGRITGHAAEAEALVGQMRSRIDAVTAKVADVPQGPKVFYELSDTLYSAAPQSFIGGMLLALKARNVAAGATTPFPQLTAEAVIAANPDVVLLADAQFGATPERVGARPGWSAIAAVQSGRLYAVDPDVMNRPGPRVADAIETLARLLYPDRFR